MSIISVMYDVFK